MFYAHRFRMGTAVNCSSGELKGGAGRCDNPDEAVSRAPLTSWERLVHLLLCSNEFVYVS